MIITAKIVFILGIIILIAVIEQILVGGYFGLHTDEFMNLVWIGFGITALGSISLAYLEGRKDKVRNQP
jgi:hypothetical protein